jgi:hypothetical protein
MKNLIAVGALALSFIFACPAEAQQADTLDFETAFKSIVQHGHEVRGIMGDTLKIGHFCPIVNLLVCAYHNSANADLDAIYIKQENLVFGLYRKGTVFVAHPKDTSSETNDLASLDTATATIVEWLKE